MDWYTGASEADDRCDAYVTWSVHVDPRWASFAAADVHTSDIKRWVQELVTAETGPAMVENASSVLRQILAMAVRGPAYRAESV
jgi:hypothetical protein